MLIGSDLEKLDEFMISLLTNDEVLDIDQGALRQQATRVGGGTGCEVYAKGMADGSLAVGLSIVRAMMRRRWRIGRREGGGKAAGGRFVAAEGH